MREKYTPVYKFKIKMKNNKKKKKTSKKRHTMKKEWIGHTTDAHIHPW